MQLISGYCPMRSSGAIADRVLWMWVWQCLVVSRKPGNRSSDLPRVRGRLLHSRGRRHWHQEGTVRLSVFWRGGSPSFPRRGRVGAFREGLEEDASTTESEEPRQRWVQDPSCSLLPHFPKKERSQSRRLPRVLGKMFSLQLAWTLWKSVRLQASS